jgi:hypothetical protein
MTVMPLYGFVQGDTMGVVVLGRLDATVAALGADLLRAAGVRLNRQGPYQLRAGARRLDLEATLRTAAMEPLERIDLVWDEGASP